MATSGIWQTMLSVGKEMFSLHGGSEKCIQNEQENIVRVGDFALDLSLRRATVCGQVLYLNYAEFDVLVFIMSNKKRIVSSHTRLHTKSARIGDQIADFSRSLLSLKKKLQEEMPGNHYIQVESWLLYDFHAEPEKVAHSM